LDSRQDPPGLPVARVPFALLPRAPALHVSIPSDATFKSAIEYTDYALQRAELPIVSWR